MVCDLDLSSKIICGIYLRAISQNVLMNLIHNIGDTSKIIDTSPRGQWVKPAMIH